MNSSTHLRCILLQCVNSWRS